MIAIFLLAGIGLAISFYTYFIEQKIQDDPNYTPACNLSDRISCTKPIKSEYANLFYVSNATAGILYYLIIAGLALLGIDIFLKIASIVGLAVSLVMAYLLYVKIQSLCLLCTSLYVINILIALYSFHIL